MSEPLVAPAAVTLHIDGREVSVPEGTTVWEAARGIGTSIPVLCHAPGLDPVAVCRVCAVEVEGARTLVASCIRKAENGMKVRTSGERVERSRRMLVELMVADHPRPCVRHARDRSCDLETMAEAWGVVPRFRPTTPGNGHDVSSPVIAVDHNACILCDRCIRACTDLQVNLVIGRTGKGHSTRIAFDTDLPMGKSSCVACGECMAWCPTGALTDKALSSVGRPLPETKVNSLCPYCGVGCAIEYSVAGNHLIQVSGRPEGQANEGRLCVKGRYGFDYAEHPERLLYPMIRRSDAAKGEAHDPPLSAFRRASWDEALALAASRFGTVRAELGPSALAGFGSAKCSNEDNYLFQKLVRTAFGTNNVDHCTRLCHASSVAALLECVGSGAVSNLFNEVAESDCALIAGSNTPENHPVAATFIKQAARRGTALIVLDPRRNDLARTAKYFVQFNPGTDVALFNGMMNVILREGLHDRSFVANRTEGFEALSETLRRYDPLTASRITGVPPATIEAIAREYATAKRSIIFWGMGISQHTTGTDNARCLIALCLLTGQIGRPGTGLHPLRGQNNVQGASDSGLIPMVYTDYQRVDNPEVRRRFEAAWGIALDPKPGLTVVEIMAAVLERKIRAMYMMGENPFLSDPNTNKVKKALATLDFLCVQDIFLTETAEYADVLLPATAFPEKTGTYTNTNRNVQIARKAIEAPGEARTDWRIVAELATRMGYRMDYPDEQAIWEELRALSPSVRGISYERMGQTGTVWPTEAAEQPSQQVLFSDSFPTTSGRGKLVPCEWAPAKELPDDDFPYILNTGRVLQHWHTGTMTRRSKALDAISPGPFVEVNPADLERLGMKDGQQVEVASRRGRIELPVRSADRCPAGSLFIPFHFKEAAANLLTTDALDPWGKIPEFKFCAVSIRALPAAN